MTQWVLQQCAWFSLYQTPAGFWIIFWVVETPVPNNSSNPISGSGFVVPVPLKGTFFEKNASTQFVKKIFKIVDSNDLAAIKFNETMCCAHCGRCTHALKSSPSVPLSHTAVLSRVYVHCTTLFSVHCARSCQDGKPHFWRLLFELYLRWAGIISEHAELCEIRDCRGVDKRAMARQCWEQVLKVGGTDLKWRGAWALCRAPGGKLFFFTFLQRH